ncbi:Uncharacterised protein [Streptococcus pneumoniae]|nr:Uncharacterised protein [Streptococcus pneumoniae]CRH97257.1 Uncharacterised protein [Streptococcus pneumoniae]
MSKYYLCILRYIEEKPQPEYHLLNLLRTQALHESVVLSDLNAQRMI